MNRSVVLFSVAVVAAAGVFSYAPSATAHPPHGGDAALILDIADLDTDLDPLTRVAGAAGPTTFGFVGTPVAGGHDMDGDGNVDFAVAHMTTTNGPDRLFAGEVQLVFGNGTIGETVDLAIAQPRVLRILGDGLFESTGSELWMGDVTGDGLGDLLIHRQSFSLPGRIGAGALTLVVGGPELEALAAGGGVLDLRHPDPTVRLFTLVGAEENARLGMWARTGDVDGDGIDDFVVAADQESLPGETFRGAAYVVRGGAHLAQNATVDLADFGSTLLAGNLAKVTPPAGADDFHFGSTNQIGDLDGNGRGEVFLAAALNRAGGILSPTGNFDGDAVGGPPGGRLFVVWDDAFPSGPWPEGYHIDLNSPPSSLTTISGGVQNVSFGEEILAGSDYDGDRRADLFVGDLAGDGSDDQSRPFAGVGYVFYRAARLKGKTFNVDQPPPGTKITKIAGPIAGAIGSDTVADGDFDGDGIDDLMIGNPHDNPEGRFHAGSMHVLFGRHGRWP
ncbi:MAG: FG-GAP repeat protein, partial [Acidobacteria bacterium]|nr:FG-GAP repeat protein [Acidobacteriota bacterium]